MPTVADVGDVGECSSYGTADTESECAILTKTAKPTDGVMDKLGDLNNAMVAMGSALNGIMDQLALLEQSQQKMQGDTRTKRTFYDCHL